MISYNRVWTLLIDKKMTKREMAEKCGLPSGTMNKLRNDVAVHLKVIERICLELDCKIEDVIEIKKD